MEEKKCCTKLCNEQMKKAQGGTTALLCSACIYYVWDGFMWVRTCGWGGLPGAGCGFESGA